MKYLLDTHILLHLLFNPKLLPKPVTKLFENDKNSFIISGVSFWEISLKFGLNKLDLKSYEPADIIDECKQLGFELLDISCETAITYNNLKPSYHKDPFDKMLIWQAIKNGLTLVSVDKNVKKYSTVGLKVIG